MKLAIAVILCAVAVSAYGDPNGLIDLGKGYFEFGGKEYPRMIKTEKAGIEMVLIEPGKFRMGSPDSERDRSADEGPRHKVKITEPFYIGKYEVTQGQYEAVMGINPSEFKGENNPVENVTWNDVNQFCQKIGGGCRPPKETEWEYACRAGTTTPFSFGEAISTDQANYDGNYTYGSGSKGVYREKTIPVGSLQPNNWGLYDMHGNVWEWCECEVLRGGSWISLPRNLRSANRVRCKRDDWCRSVGFRVAWTP